MHVFDVHVRPDKSRMVIHHYGLFTTDDCAAMAEAFKRQATAFGGRPFTVLVDATRGQTLPPEGRVIIEELQRWALARGLRKSAVVIADPVMGFQYRRMVRESGIAVTEQQFQTWEEAEAYLDADD